MDTILNLIFIILFFGCMIITGKILIDSNFEKLFKQGRVATIRVAYAVVMIVVSFLLAFAVRELIASFYNLFA